MRKWISLVLSIFSIHFAYAFQTLLYVDERAAKNSSEVASVLSQLQANQNKITILAASVYAVDETGKISGGLAKPLAKWAAQAQIKMMPVLVNKEFNSTLLGKFLANPIAQEHTIKKILAICEKHHYYGLQLDFENFPSDDKDQYAAFVVALAEKMHAQHFVLSVTVQPPSVTENMPKPDAQWFLKNSPWGYDYAKLAQACDFITVMAYDDHNSETTPGAIAPANWVRAVIKSLLTVIPAEKFSLGVPVYSGHWRSGGEEEGYHSYRQALTYANAENLLKQYNVTAQWQAQAKVNYAVFEHDYMNEYVFIEDAAAFRAKYDLAKQYHLRGISIWQLGFEDPQIWPILPSSTSKIKAA